MDLQIQPLVMEDHVRGPREEQIIFASGYEGRILYTAVFCFNKIHLS